MLNLGTGKSCVNHTLKSDLSQEAALKHHQKPMLDSPSQAAQPIVKYNTSDKNQTSTVHEPEIICHKQIIIRHV